MKIQLGPVNCKSRLKMSNKPDTAAAVQLYLPLIIFPGALFVLTIIYTVLVCIKRAKVETNTELSQDLRAAEESMSDLELAVDTKAEEEAPAKIHSPEIHSDFPSNKKRKIRKKQKRANDKQQTSEANTDINAPPDYEYTNVKPQYQEFCNPHKILYTPPLAEHPENSIQPQNLALDGETKKIKKIKKLRERIEARIPDSKSLQHLCNSSKSFSKDVKKSGINSIESYQVQLSETDRSLDQALSSVQPQAAFVQRIRRIKLNSKHAKMLTNNDTQPADEHTNVEPPYQAISTPGHFLADPIAPDLSKGSTRSETPAALQETKAGTRINKLLDKMEVRIPDSKLLQPSSHSSAISKDMRKSGINSIESNQLSENDINIDQALSSVQPPVAFVQMIKNSKTIVQLAIETVAEMNDIDDPITADLRSVAELHLTEIEEAWNGVTNSESLPDLMLFTGFIEAKCVVISDLHNTYNTYANIKLGSSSQIKTSSSAPKFQKSVASAEILAEYDEDIYNRKKYVSKSGSNDIPNFPGVSSVESRVIERLAGASSASLAKRHKSRLKKITQKLKAQEEKNQQSKGYWKQKVNKILERSDYDYDYL